MPAAIVTIWYGAQGTAQLLILSQVVLSPQPFAVVPLVMFTADKRKMGAGTRWLTALAVLIAVTVIHEHDCSTISFLGAVGADGADAAGFAGEEHGMRFSPAIAVRLRRSCW